MALEGSWPLPHTHKWLKFWICLLAGMFHGAQSLINPQHHMYKCRVGPSHLRLWRTPPPVPQRLPAGGGPRFGSFTRTKTSRVACGKTEGFTREQWIHNLPVTRIHDCSSHRIVSLALGYCAEVLGGIGAKIDTLHPIMSPAIAEILV